MTFSATDIPDYAPIAIVDFVREVQGSVAIGAGLSASQIETLTAKLEDSVNLTSRSLEIIIDYDLSWRTSVFQGKTEYDLAISNRIENGFRSWLKATESLLTHLETFRSCGLRVESLESLTPRVLEARRMLTPDDEYFEGEELDDLAAQAIAEDNRGETSQFRKMGE